jgi:serine phosphatase RsbU (regulator of sigma subunit)
MQNLSQHNDSINDGMDISICCYEPGQNTLVWSGANNPLWILRNGEIIEVAPTKRPIGRSSIEAVFEEHLFTLLENDFLLLFSDGVIDQFGGPSGKKFKKTQLREIVLAEHYLTSKALVKAIESASLYWMKDNVQIDDIAVLALDIRL